MQAHSKGGNGKKFVIGKWTSAQKNTRNQSRLVVTHNIDKNPKTISKQAGISNMNVSMNVSEINAEVTVDTDLCHHILALHFCIYLLFINCHWNILNTRGSGLQESKESLHATRLPLQHGM